MGERKVLNQYYPPDIDPSKVPRVKRVRSEETQMKVRMMLPMSVRCNTCGNFMYKGTKFNTRMEDVKGERYLGIKIFRFYYRCTNCSAEFCMKTDPKSADYIVEAGASRNYEAMKERERVAADAVAEREDEERGNAIKALENRTLESKREMDALAALDEVRSLRSRQETVGVDAALAALKRAAVEEEDEDALLDAQDEEAVRQMLLQRAGFIKRLSDSEEEEEATLRFRDGGDDEGAGVSQALQQGDSMGALGSRDVDARLDGGWSAARDVRDGGAKKRQRPRGASGPSAAAVALMMEETESAADERVAKNEAQQDGQESQDVARGWTMGGAAAAAAADVEAKQQGGLRKSNNRGQLEGGANGGHTSDSMATKHELSRRGGGLVSEPPPPSVPSFGGRSAAVVVKRKPKPRAPQQQSIKTSALVETKIDEVEDGEAGEGVLLGLADYGSDSE